MCVLALAWAATPRWRLVAVANRDELHARPTLPLARWAGSDGILAGRDVSGGGTWLGVSPAGRFAAVTNIRNPAGPDPAKLSRGALVRDALGGGGATGDEDLDRFNPFNLIVVGGAGATLLSNRPAPLRAELRPGLHGLSNGAPDVPWPKTERLKAALAAWIARGSDDVAPLFAALRDEQRPAATAGDGDPANAPIFIRDARYGTRCSTILTVDARGNGRVIERAFDAAGHATGEVDLTFAWPDPAERRAS